MISRVDQRKVTQVSSEGGGVLHRVTFLLWVAFSAQWKLAVKNRSRPTKRLLRVKTSATMDHCQPSLDTANSPPARTAPGPGPDSLTATEGTGSDSFGFIFHRGVAAIIWTESESLKRYSQRNEKTFSRLFFVFF